MADQNFMDLASKSSSAISETDYLLGVNASEAYRMLIKDLAEVILNKLTSKTYSGLNTSAKNFVTAINEVNNNLKDGIKVEQGAASVNSTYITGGNCTYWKFGKVVSFRCTGTLSYTKLPLNSFAEVITGLPASPVQNFAVNLVPLTEDNVYGCTPVFMNGGVSIQKSRSFNGQYYVYISGTYVCS